MAFRGAKAMLGEAVIKQILKYLSNEPEKNLVRMLQWGETLARDPKHKEYTRSWAKAMQEEDNNWRKLAIRTLNQVSPNVRDKTGINFFVHAGILAPSYRKRAEEKYGIHIPWAMLIDPTGRCNLRCKGCWAAEYDRTKDMDYETLDRVIGEAEELGIRFIVVSGGEPTVRMEDLLSLAEKYDELLFHIFTNGTLIDKETAKRCAEIGNLTFAISVEGFEEQTDDRRGKGVFKKVMQAMDNLREAGVVYGFSATYTRDNAEIIESDEFIDLMVDKGCIFGWLFTYVPVGGGADLEYMATPDQRRNLYKAVNKWRTEKPIFVVDFWNDGWASGGCIAGGRSYFHINATGEVEPCAFIHYANMNIKDTSLVEALKSPLFKAYQESIPFNENLLRPCPLIDNPERLQQMVEETGAYPTQTDKLTASVLCQPLHGYAKAWGEIADDLWEKNHVKKQQPDLKSKAT
ncbi:MAG: radical SAM protein [Firmicutes bacterium]|jgi:MoaA/NifB/PqqE/SkfB family radical SAM enzyme|nr:radical SAM protein [Bacillota bacterium]